MYAQLRLSIAQHLSLFAAPLGRKVHFNGQTWTVNARTRPMGSNQTAYLLGAEDGRSQWFITTIAF